MIPSVISSGINIFYYIIHTLVTSLITSLLTLLNYGRKMFNGIINKINRIGNKIVQVYSVIMAGFIFAGVLQLVVLLKSERDKRKKNYLDKGDESDSDNESENIIIQEGGKKTKTSKAERNRRSILGRRNDRLRRREERRNRRMNNVTTNTNNVTTNNTTNNTTNPTLNNPLDPPPPYSA